MGNEAAKFYHRPELAQAIADQALDESLGISGGTFLTAPRRTGKSTFVRQDLVPEFERRGLNVIYVDLWIDRTINPAIHIANAVRSELMRDDGYVTKAFKKLLGTSKLNVGALGGGLSFDLSQLNMSKETNLADALKAIAKASKKKLILVIDEAQHAITTSEGNNALFSLKATRDSLNTDLGMYGMHLVATGSSRDKLASLVSSREQAFFGADMVSFPVLGNDYVEWAVARSGIKLDVNMASDVFLKIGSRPEIFQKVLRDLRKVVLIDKTSNLDDLLRNLAIENIRQSKNSFLNAMSSMHPLQSALLKEIAVDSLSGPDGRRVGLFSAAMKSKLQARLVLEIGDGHGMSVEASAIQNALDKLRDDNFLWKSQRGNYSVEDDQYVDWIVEDMQEQVDAETPIHADRPAG